MKPILTVTAALILGACSPQYIVSLTPVCEATTIVWVSKSDKLTSDTASAVEANNLAHEKLCGPSRPPEMKPKKGEAKVVS